jgi:hypothetical protein
MLANSTLAARAPPLRLPTEYVRAATMQVHGRVRRQALCCSFLTRLLLDWVNSANTVP